jgi:hypothetical protein
MTDTIEIVIANSGRCIGNISCPVYKTLDKMEKGVAENKNQRQKLNEKQDDEIGFSKLFQTLFFYIKSTLSD